FLDLLWVGAEAGVVGVFEDVVEEGDDDGVGAFVVDGGGDLGDVLDVRAAALVTLASVGARGVDEGFGDQFVVVHASRLSSVARAGVVRRWRAATRRGSSSPCTLLPP